LCRRGRGGVVVMSSARARSTSELKVSEVGGVLAYLCLCGIISPRR
jgi:hypothetical protein